MIIRAHYREYTVRQRDHLAGGLRPYRGRRGQRRVTPQPHPYRKPVPNPKAFSTQRTPQQHWEVIPVAQSTDSGTTLTPRHQVGMTQSRSLMIATSRRENQMNTSPLHVRSFAAALLTLALAATALAQTEVTTKLFEFRDATNTDIPGFPLVTDSWATLIREDDRVFVMLETSGLPAGTYTLWLTTFNHPEFCDGPCDETDLAPRGGNPMILSSANRIDNEIVGEDGIGRFSGHLYVGDTTEAFFGPGLLHPDTAEIQIRVRFHGPVADVEMLGEQLHLVGGGCDVNTMGPHAVGVGFLCYDPQMVVFAAPE